MVIKVLVFVSKVQKRRLDPIFSTTKNVDGDYGDDDDDSDHGDNNDDDADHDDSDNDGDEGGGREYIECNLLNSPI